MPNSNMNVSDLERFVVQGMRAATSFTIGESQTRRFGFDGDSDATWKITVTKVAADTYTILARRRVPR